MKLANTEKKTIPFSKEKSVDFLKGQVLGENNHELFQYSISMEPHLGFYRATLSFEQGEVRVVLVLKVRHVEGEIEIQAENEQAKEVWLNPNHIKHQLTKQALKLIVQKQL